VTWDPRGTGSSDPLPGPYYTRDFMEDLRAVIDAIGNRPVVMIGNSRGSTVAAHFATSHPHLVEKLVLAGLAPARALSGTDYPRADRLDKEFFGRLRAAMAADDWPAVVRIFIAQVAAGEPGCQKLIEGSIRLWSQMPLETLKNFFMLDDPGIDVRAILPALRMPTLVLHGESDRITPVEAGRWIAEQIPGAQFHVLKGRSHMFAATATAEFAEVVRRFIRTGRPS
jgi:pimeloyl-ACP methyl ester carboxylesterase